MKTLMSCAALLAVLAAPAAAETRYDRKLEQAVMNIMASKKIAEMRGGFTFDQRLDIVIVQDAITTGSIGVEFGSIVTESPRASMPRATVFGPFAPAGPRPVVERRVSRVIAF